MTGGRGFAARYHGRCAGCGEPIEPGDVVAYDAEDQLVCAGCDATAEPPAPARREKVCGSCHLVLPCFCEAG